MSLFFTSFLEVVLDCLDLRVRLTRETSDDFWSTMRFLVLLSRLPFWDNDMNWALL